MIAILLQCLQFGINEIVPIGMLAEKLKSIFTLDPNAQVNIQHLGADAIDADSGTIDLVNAWRVANGFPALVFADAPLLGAAAPPAPGSTLVQSYPAETKAAIGETGEHGDVGHLGTNAPKAAGG